MSHPIHSEDNQTAWTAQACKTGLSRLGLAVVLLLATGFRLWNLGANEYGNLYYAAAVRSMAGNWHNCLYGAFDAAGFLSIDKPPVAFWLQVLSVKLFGYHGLSLHLPQAIEGILSVALVYFLTRRVVGEWGGLLAGLVMAVMPASVAVDRSNLPDSCLLLVLLLAAWVVLHAAETGRWKWLLLGAALVGLGFNVKLVAAYVVLPTFYLVYWLGAAAGRKARFAHLCAATAMVVAVSLSWPLVVDWTPARSRPYVGDTQDNSVLSLAFGLHGVQRIAGRGMRPPGPPPFGSGPGAGGEEFTGHGGRPGAPRLANRDMAGHITWLIPFAMVGVVVCFTSHPLVPSPRLHQSALLWGGWFATYAMVFSFSQTPIHPHYLAVLAPPIAALVGIGAVCFWRAFERGGRWLVLPVATIALTAIWQAWVLGYHAAWAHGLRPLLLAGSAASVAGLLLGQSLRRHPAVARQIGSAAMTLCLGILLICPIAWSLTPVLAPGGRMVPVADPVLLSREKRQSPSDDIWQNTQSLARFLRDHHKAERFLLAVPDVHPAAAIIIQTGEPVMAYGGFTGSDPILTVQHFAGMVESGEVGFVMLVDRLSPGGRRSDRHNPIETWVREHGQEVPTNLWRGMEPPPDDSGRPPAPWGETAAMVRRMFCGPGARLYDCRPAASSRVSAR